jgi:hypothetical protein
MSSPINALSLAAKVVGLVFLSAALVLRASTLEAPEAQYLSEINAAMMRMHAGMAVQPTGDVDADFVAMMIPHHQGAIDMARAQLRYGHNEKLARISQEIIVTQEQEIAAMRLAFGKPLAPSATSPAEADSRATPDGNTPPVKSSHAHQDP